MFWRRVIPATFVALGFIVVAFLSFRPPPNLCGEQEEAVRQQDRTSTVFLPGKSGIKSESVRTVTMDRTGVWLGYAGSAGVGHFNGQHWRLCTQSPHVNSIAIDRDGHPWVGTDAPTPTKSVLYYNGKNWEDKALEGQKLNPPLDHRVYGLTWVGDTLYVGTYQGLGLYHPERGWSTFAIQDERTETAIIRSSHIHSVAVAQGEIWLGTINQGVMGITPDGHLRGAIEPAVAGNNIRKVAISPFGDEVWFVSDPGGISVFNYTTKQWRTHHIPGADKLNDVQFDPLGRPCVAATDETTGGVHCRDDKGQWRNILHVPTPTYSVAFGCKNCVFGEEEFAAGTVRSGLVMGKIPK